MDFEEKKSADLELPRGLTGNETLRPNICGLLKISKSKHVIFLLRRVTVPGKCPMEFQLTQAQRPDFDEYPYI